MVERFEFTCHDSDPDIVSVNHGRWVSFSDYEALRSELEQARRERDGFRDIAARKSDQVAALIKAEAAERLAGARVKVKPLEWEDADEGMCTKWRAAALGGHYELVALDGDDGGLAVNFHWGRPLSFWFIQGEPDERGPTGPKMFPALEDAKAAAQADYERRILSALAEPAGEAEPLSAQIERLASFIMEHVPGEPSQSEGAVDCAIRIIRNSLTTPPASAIREALPATGPYVDRLIRIFRDRPDDDGSAVVLQDYARAALAGAKP